LAREGLPVLIHGTATESSRVFTSKVLAALDIPAQTAITEIAPGAVKFYPTALLCPGLQRLLEVRRVLNLRNPAHSLVKLMNPCAGKGLLVTSYTHPEYAVSMAATLQLLNANALLIRGTEGEAVADPRRTPKMQAIVGGVAQDLDAYQGGSLSTLPDIPASTDAELTAQYIRQVLGGEQAVPAPIAQQVATVVKLAQQL
jgi:anthranilate phosphoribosyltransferase